MKKSLSKLSARLVFARNLRQVRRLKDLSQEALALNADLSRTYVSGVVRGDRNISIDNMDSLAIAVGVPLKELVDPEMLIDLKGITP
jgi:transcriptional regulator with XRE-family HTH domain